LQTLCAEINWILSGFIWDEAIWQSKFLTGIDIGLTR